MKTGSQLSSWRRKRENSSKREKNLREKEEQTEGASEETSERRKGEKRKLKGTLGVPAVGSWGEQFLFR